MSDMDSTVKPMVTALLLELVSLLLPDMSMITSTLMVKPRSSPTVVTMGMETVTLRLCNHGDITITVVYTILNIGAQFSQVTSLN